jgi:excisionase family DNA binding protein
VTQQNPFSDVWTEDQLAEQAGVSVRTIKRWRDQRKGPPFIRMGRRILYRRDAVADWLLANEQEQPRAGAR